MKGQDHIDAICSTKDEAWLLMPILRMVVLFLIPFSIMLYCYSVVIYRLWQSTATEIGSTSASQTAQAAHSNSPVMEARQ